MAAFKKEWLTDLEQARVVVENAINKEVSCTPPSASNVRSALKRVRDDIFREWPKPATQPLMPGLRINFADETWQTAAADALAGDNAKRCGTCGATATIAWRYVGENEMYLEDAKTGRRWPRCENHPPNRAEYKSEPLPNRAEYKSEPLLKPAIEKSRARAAARRKRLGVSR